MMKTNYDKYKRYRSVTVAFRASPEENEMINRMVKLSGMTKQGYILSRLECKDVIVIGNPRVYKGLKHLLIEIRDLLVQIQARQEIPDEELSELIAVVANVLGDMKHGSNADHEYKCADYRERTRK